jgi:hypothetical protein
MPSVGIRPGRRRAADRLGQRCSGRTAGSLQKGIDPGLDVAAEVEPEHLVLDRVVVARTAMVLPSVTIRPANL